uniref:Uncharacterized protein n=1 Tax=Physcomitrium patens TaxID=3218 RepID=A0A2K1JLD5_PHYPA|nr:hypothetical protein PHYPA_017194 [Physcomitrium patens]
MSMILNKALLHCTTNVLSFAFHTCSLLKRSCTPTPSTLFLSKIKTLLALTVSFQHLKF